MSCGSNAHVEDEALMYDEDVWLKTVTVVEREKPTKPLLYDHKGVPLVKAPQPVGFHHPKQDKKKSR